MSSYHYKTSAPAVLEAAQAWGETRKTFDARRQKMADVFGGPGSPMRSGNDNYVGGVKISASKDLDVHWCRPDDHGYRSLRTSAKIPKGTEKEARGELKTEHERLLALWAEHCPVRISQDETWKAIGLDWGSIWLSGGVFFELNGAVYLTSVSSSGLTVTRSKARPRSWPANSKRPSRLCSASAKLHDPHPHLLRWAQFKDQQP